MGCLNCACLREPLLASANSAVVTQVPAGIKVTEGDKSQGSHLEKAPAIIVIPPEESEEPEFSAEPAQATLQPQASIEAAFKIFLGANRYNLTRIDGATFVKGCRDCHLIGAHLSVTDADLLFARLAHGIGGKRGLDLHQFRAALDSIAMKKGTSTEELCIGIQSSGGPVSHGTTKAQTVRFHDDKSQYTGVHRHDGPDVGRKAGGHLPRFAHSDLRTPKAKDGGEGFGNTLAFPVDMDTAVSRATSLAADVAHNSFNSDASSIPPPTTFTLDHKGTDEDSDVSLTDVFQAYCAGKSDLDGRSFVKLLKDCNLFGSGFGQNDADLIFAKLSTQARRRISMEQFRVALQMIADKKKEDMKTICSAVARSSGRKLVGTKAENVRFYDDRLADLPRTSIEPGATGHWMSSLRPEVPVFVQQRCGEVAHAEAPGPKENVSFQLQRQTIRRRRGSSHPKGSDHVTMVFTDVQGSTSLWEKNARAMEIALRIHDNLMRQNIAKYGGYEVTTEGDAFQAVFHDAIDAVEFCLSVQTELCKCKWPEATLQHPDAMPSRNGVWSGLRVRMGMHSGRPEVDTHELTGRVRYEGQSVAIAKAIEDTCHGGQIVLSAQSFAQIDGILQHLGSPQVIDLGHHALHAHGLRHHITMHLLQLVPAHLAFDYFACDPDDPTLPESGGTGRLFPPILSKGLISPGFHEAPAGASVALCFVFTQGARDLVASKHSIATEALGSLRTCVRDLLRKDGKSGYECQEDEGAFMLAFNGLEHAAAFGAALQKALPQIPWSPELRAIQSDGLRVAVGAFSGKYTSRGPHTSTGRADYFGTMVNRTARIAAAASAGQVLLGAEDAISTNAMSMPSGSQLERLGAFKLKGVETPIGLYEVRTPNAAGQYPSFPEPKTKGRVGD